MYRLVVKPDQRDVIHQEHPYEECNVDDAIDREWVALERAREIVAVGQARCCEHCLSEGLPE